MISSSRQRGFTLIETVVSLLLLAVISVLSYQAVEVVLGTNERSRGDLVEETELQRAWQIIGRDILHLRPRLYVDVLGSTEFAYVTDKSEFGVRFSRGGGPMIRSNPSGVRRIDYRINEDQQLVRTSWAITESPRLSDGSAMILLSKVNTVVFEQLTDAFEYDRNWPPLNSRIRDRALPKMVRITIELESGSETTRLFPGVQVD
ncbi:MAG: type II secretion system minor pseudopilin GspJ [Porticoccaceae bacterium]|nr:type II secretion system minor pseudopilin GspJ [Porticoccaceae bacterium]